MAFMDNTDFSPRKEINEATLLSDELTRKEMAVP
jgi:hypothetical protein